jgi:hypothetical protein
LYCNWGTEADRLIVTQSALLRLQQNQIELALDGGSGDSAEEKLCPTKTKASALDSNRPFMEGNYTKSAIAGR